MCLEMRGICQPKTQRITSWKKKGQLLEGIFAPLGNEGAHNGAKPGEQGFQFLLRGEDVIREGSNPDAPGNEIWAVKNLWGEIPLRGGNRGQELTCEEPSLTGERAEALGCHDGIPWPRILQYGKSPREEGKKKGCALAPEGGKGRDPFQDNGGGGKERRGGEEEESYFFFPVWSTGTATLTISPNTPNCCMRMLVVIKSPMFTTLIAVDDIFFGSGSGSG